MVKVVRTMAAIPLLLGIFVLAAAYGLSQEPSPIALALHQPLCLAISFVPFLVLSLAMARLQEGLNLTKGQQIFLLLSGFIAILAILLPGMAAAWKVSPDPVVGIWLALAMLVLVGMAFAMGIAYLMIRYFWLHFM